jgi:hypothetical protein
MASCAMPIAAFQTRKLLQSQLPIAVQYLPSLSDIDFSFYVLPFLGDTI